MSPVGGAVGRANRPRDVVRVESGRLVRLITQVVVSDEPARVCQVAGYPPADDLGAGSAAGGELQAERVCDPLRCLGGREPGAEEDVVGGGHCSPSRGDVGLPDVLVFAVWGDAVGEVVASVGG